MDLCAALLDQMRLGSSVSEILCTFNETYRNSRDDKYFHLFLCAATFHNHVDVVKHLLTDRRCDKDETSLKGVLKSIFVAISSGNVALVEAFLRSSPCLELLESHFHIAPGDCNNNGHEASAAFHTIKSLNVKRKSIDLFSAVECACICDQRDIIKLLVTYVCDQQRRSIEAQACSSSNRGSPLDVVVNLVRKDCFRRMVTLSTIVQIVLDARLDVDALNPPSRALDLLIDIVIDLPSKSVTITADECQMFAETARILLAAVASSPADRIPRGPLEKLLRITFTRGSWRALNLQSSVARDVYYRMISEIVKHFFRHGAVNTRLSKRELLKRVLTEAILCVRTHLEVEDATRRETIETRVGGISDVFNYVLLMDADVSGYLLSDASTDGVESEHNATFQLAFEYLAGYSAEFGGRSSSRFVRLLLIRLSFSQANQLKTRLMKCPRDVPPFQYVPKEYTERALELVSEFVVSPLFRLQHLARDTIIRALSSRCLGAQEMATLNLPHGVAEYILLRIG